MEGTRPIHFGGIFVLVMLYTLNSSGRPSYNFSSFYQARVGLKILKSACSCFQLLKIFSGGDFAIKPFCYDFSIVHDINLIGKSRICLPLGNKNIRICDLSRWITVRKLNGSPYSHCINVYVCHSVSLQLKNEVLLPEAKNVLCRRFVQRLNCQSSHASKSSFDKLAHGV